MVDPASLHEPGDARAVERYSSRQPAARGSLTRGPASPRRTKTGTPTPRTGTRPSKVGREFAARHAEETFTLYPNIEGARKGIAEQREIVVAHGRKADDLKFIQGFSFVVGSTEEEAWRKSEEIDKWVSYEGLAAHISRDMGIDLGGLDPEMPLEQSAMSGVQGYARMFEDSNPGKKARVKDLVGALS